MFDILNSTRLAYGMLPNGKASLAARNHEAIYSVNNDNDESTDP